MANFTFDSNQRFVVRNYHQQPAFASFLPGIAGLMGIPLWVFYVNRGQAIASFGVESKDVPIVEFQPASKAWQSVAATGFRTFIRIAEAQFGLYEPFGACVPDPTGIKRQMAIGMNDLSLLEEAPRFNLRVEVRYCTLTDEPLAGLIRQVTITNTGPAEQTLEVVDGLPVIVPFGMNDALLKHMTRTAEAWMGVFTAAEHVPFYRLRSSIADSVEVQGYEAGHFCVAFTGEGTRLPALVDPTTLFAENTSLSMPDRLVQGGLDAVLASPQITLGRMPCGFFGLRRTLAAGESLRINGIVGHATSMGVLQAHLERMTQPVFVAEQAERAVNLAREITDCVGIATSQPLLDAYTRQTFLDNVLRGGWPVVFEDGDRRFVQHVYSRKHGDLERDYNAFFLAAEHYSQGNGNYRDVNQNRREDVWLNPAIEDYDIITFMNLIQTDGYNPLVVRGNVYRLPDESARAALLTLVEAPEKLAPVLEGTFTPGSLLKAVVAGEPGLRVSLRAFLDRVLASAEQQFEADFGEGYWTDHWTYNLDLIENFLGIYPDRKRQLLFEKPVFTYYDSDAAVRPRHQKHVLVEGVVRQRGAIWHDPEKARLIAARAEYPHVMRDQHGRGDIFRTTLTVKLVGLAAIKCATLDPAGVGIEMEANKPGWYDALNGLPGLFGSGLPETFELIRLLRFIQAALSDAPAAALALPVEIAELLAALAVALDTYEHSPEASRDFAFWEACARARERYRQESHFGFGGSEQDYPVGGLVVLLERLTGKLQDGVDRAAGQNDGLPPTYLRFNALSYEPLPEPVEAGLQPVRVTAFEAVMLPLFLEGPVRQIRIETDPERALALHQQVKVSPLYDQKLGMYKVNAPLDAEPFDIGRARAFPPGWLENESIWLHMEYKYLLALLKAGLYEAFYAELRQVLIPFQPPERYGRSPLENSSFIVSSAHPDVRLHGRGYTARLSGSTAEYLSILNHLMFGPQPFLHTAAGLTLRLAPALAGWLFNEQGALECTFLGAIRVIYLNPARASTFGPDAVHPARIVLASQTGTTTEITEAVIPAPLAEQVRQGTIAQITIHLA